MTSDSAGERAEDASRLSRDAGRRLDSGAHDSGTRDSTRGGASVKWHPGHFLFNEAALDAPALYGTAESIINTSARINNSATGKPAYAGYQVAITWYWLDMGSGANYNGGPTDGTPGGGTLAPAYASTQYNTVIIDTILGYLASASSTYGKTFRLSMELLPDSVNEAPKSISSSQPVPYSSASTSGGGVQAQSLILPQYIVTPGVSGRPGASGSPASTGDAFFNGAYGSGPSAYSFGVVAAFWRPEVMTAYCNLIAYLGAKYNDNPYFELIDPWDQPSDAGYTSYGGTTLASDMTEARVVSAYEQLISCTSEAFPNTNKVFTTNFPNVVTTLSDLEVLTAYASNRQVGTGTEDLSIPMDGTTLTSGGSWYNGPGWGEQIWQGVGTNGNPSSADFGSMDYRGTVPFFAQEFQSPFNGVTPGGSDEATQAESWGYDDDRYTHMSWIYAPTASPSPPAVTFAQQDAALAAHGYRVQTACPSTYTGGCSTN